MRISRTIPEAADRPVALTIGNFDGVHTGHQAMLALMTDAARARGLETCVLTFERGRARTRAALLRDDL